MSSPTNLCGTFPALTQAAQHMTSDGRIIAFSSSVPARFSPTYGPYIASEAGVGRVVHVLANELRKCNVIVLGVESVTDLPDEYMQLRTADNGGKFVGEISGRSFPCTHLKRHGGGWSQFAYLS